MAKGWTDKRPMSPHLSIWKWHPTMLSSILHRATGVVLFVSLILLAIVLALLAAGPHWFAKVEPLVYSPVGVILFFLVVGVLLYHFLNGLRHLVWDMGAGFDPKQANMVSLVTILVAVISSAVLTWLLMGAVQ